MGFLYELPCPEADQHAEAHTRDVEDSLSHYKAHGEEEVGGWEVGEDQEREGDGHCSVSLSTATETPRSKSCQTPQHQQGQQVEGIR